MRHSIPTLAALLLSTAPALAQDADLRADTINSATYDGGMLADGQSALTFKTQVLLDRAGISPGVVDGYKGGMSESALRAFERREGLPEDGILDAEVWAALGGDTAAPIVSTYPITAEDQERVRGPPPGA